MTSISDSIIKVGMVLPFSGLPALRENGRRIHCGTAAWINSYNERGGHAGRQVELIVEDSAYDTAVLAKAVRKLNEQDDVVALLNTNGTPQLTAAMPYMQREKLPLLLPFAGAEEWYNPPRWGVIGVQPPFNESGYLLGKWAAAEGHRNVAIFHPDYPEISVSMAQYAKRGFDATAANDGGAEFVCVPLGSTDGKAMADAILSHEPDAVIVLVNWPELTSALTEIVARGKSLPCYSWAANVTQQIADQGGNLLEGMKGQAATIVTPDGESLAAAEYRDALSRYFPDQAPDITSLTAFAHAQIFTTALDTISGNVTRDSLVAAFEALGTVERHILPTVSFSSGEHLGASAIQRMQIINGRWRPIGDEEQFPKLDA